MRRVTILRRLPVLFFAVACTSAEICAAAEHNEKNDVTAKTAAAGNKRPGKPITLDRPDGSAHSIPFIRTGNLILVQAQADTSAGYFVLDTGCSGLVLNVSHFSGYAIGNGDAEERHATDGMVSSVHQTVVRRFLFASMVHRGVYADLVDLRHIEQARGIKILGLIGMRLLDRCEMLIDYKQQTLHIRQIDKRGSNTGSLHMINVASRLHIIPIEVTNSIVLVHTQVGGKKVKLAIDSGAESNVLSIGLLNKTLKEVEFTGRVLITGAGNNKILAHGVKMKRLQVGSYSVNDVPVLFANLNRGCSSYGTCVDGILGFDFLSAQAVGFDFVNKKMYIW